MKTLIFGDSITEGNSDNLEGGWANMLKFKFLNEFNENRIVNLGIGGDEISDILKRLDIFTKAYIEKYNKKCNFIFAIGINDSVTNIDGTKYLYSLGEFEENLEKLIFMAKKYNPKSIKFIGLTNVNEKLVNPFPLSTTGKCFKNNRIKKFDEIIKKVSEKNNYDFVEMFDILENEDMPDGLHPNNNGHKKMFEKVKKYIN